MRIWIHLLIFDADPDMTFHFDADPDPPIDFGVDPNPRILHYTLIM